MLLNWAIGSLLLIMYHFRTWWTICSFISFTSLRARVFNVLFSPFTMNLSEKRNYTREDVETVFWNLSKHISPFFSEMAGSPSRLSHEEILDGKMNVNFTLLIQSVLEGLPPTGVTFEEFYNLAAETAAYMSTDHPDYRFSFFFYSSPYTVYG
jgi:hypothetical protein